MFDLADPAFLDDPYPAFAELRAAGEVHHHAGLGMAVAVSHAACSTLLRHRDLGRIWTDARPLERFASFNLLHRNSLLENEPPAHTRLRRSISWAFGRGHVERLRPWIGELAAEMVDGLAAEIAERGEADLMAHVAQPLPVAVITGLLGVPVADGPRFVAWSNAIVKMYEHEPSEAARDTAETAAAEFVAYLRELVRHRSTHLGEDMISDLVRGELTPDEVVGTAVLLLMAGHEATVNVIGNGMHALLDRPDQWHRLVAEPSLVDNSVDELIRFDAPLQLFVRTATEDVEIAGFRVAKGEKIAALLGAADRDPLVFNDPDRLDVGRAAGSHLGFSAGIHYCVAAPLARLEIAAALTALVARLPDPHPARPPRRRPEFAIRGLRELPVTR
ncbi:MAG TPA: cytochrome P450 [Pseudonocardiaceae bacterium]|nr:cytochrome P450 [Pseudonocardiaceae bacterium]